MYKSLVDISPRGQLLHTVYWYTLYLSTKQTICCITGNMVVQQERKIKYIILAIISVITKFLFLSEKTLKLYSYTCMDCCICDGTRYKCNGKINMLWWKKNCMVKKLRHFDRLVNRWRPLTLALKLKVTDITEKRIYSLSVTAIFRRQVSNALKITLYSLFCSALCKISHAHKSASTWDTARS